MNNVHPVSAPALVYVSESVGHCPPPSRNFHGRQDILKAMHQFFAQDVQKQKVYVLYGLGGTGKTQIALKFIEKSTRFKDQFFVDASSMETIETGLMNIAAARRIGNSLQDALTWLASRRENWLLLFDNADDPQINLNRFFPKCPHGNIIVTSRNPGLKVYGAYSQVSDLKARDSVTLLLKSAGEETSSANELLAAKIVKELAYLPLAIVQAGAFISESGALNSYLALYQRHRAQLLSEKPAQSHDDYAWTVYTTWQISFNKLSPLAAMLLQLCSFDLSKRELHMARKFLSPFVKLSGEWDPLRFSKLTNELKAYSLINYNAGSKLFSIHPLLHSWSQTTITNLELYHSCMSAILGMAIQGMSGKDRRLTSLILVSHLDSLRRWHKLGTDFQQEYAIIYLHAARYADAEKIWVIEVENTRKLWGDDHSATLRSMSNLAITYDKWGQFKKAEKLNLVVLEKQRKFLGDDHIETLDAMFNLSITYSNLGQTEKAKKLQIVVLEKWRKVLGDDHSSTLTAMHYLALTNGDQGQFKEAKKLQVLVLEKRKKILGDDHPDTWDTMNSLGCSYHHLGKFMEAERLLLVALEKRRQFYGDNHPKTQRAMRNLWKTYYSLNKQGEAAELKRLIINKTERV
ncbi:P-loop containing nucleoside triphosphate hydrolase protein [Mycena sanguinolenta]|nr:P-loop containing nucleoside triphosphate hydrolase protein [Mycena sanguinolenta]